MPKRESLPPETSDENVLTSKVYAESFRGILKQLKDDLKLESLNFVIGRICDFDMANKTYPHWTRIRLTTDFPGDHG